MLKHKNVDFGRRLHADYPGILSGDAVRLRKSNNKNVTSALSLLRHLYGTGMICGHAWHMILYGRHMIPYSVHAAVQYIFLTKMYPRSACIRRAEDRKCGVYAVIHTLNSKVDGATYTRCTCVHRMKLYCTSCTFEFSEIEQIEIETTTKEIQNDAGPYTVL